MNPIEKTLSYEGGYSNDPSDPGSETNFGISKKSYPNVDIAGLTKDQAIAIYQRDFWTPLLCDQIADKRVAWKLFDIAVNHGTIDAVRMVQFIVGASIDGIMGPDTLHKINCYNPQDLLFELSEESIKQHIGLVEKNPHLSEFIVGWITRDLDRGADLV